MEKFNSRRSRNNWRIKWLKVFLLWGLGILGVQGDLCHESCGDKDIPPCSWRRSKYTLTCENKLLTKIPTLERDASSSVVTVALFDGNHFSLEGRLTDLGYKDVQEMSFKGCMIDEIPDTTFSSLTALRVLELRNNLLTSIETGDFADLHGLTFLDLSSNRITNIDPHSFDNMKSLVTLDISNNKLHSLKLPGLGAAPLARIMPKLSEIVLSNNLWRCNCELGPLYQEMMSRSMSPGEAQCHGDNGEEMIRWSQLPPENFTCAPNLLTVTPNQFVELGDDLTLECRFESNPAPTFVYWTLNDNPLSEDNITTSHTDTLLVTQTKTRLKLFDIDEEDLGEYLCHATNSERSTSSSVKIFLTQSLNQSPDMVGLIIGLVVSFVILLGLIAFAVFCFRRLKIGKEDDSIDHNESSYAILDTSNSLPAMRKEGSDINWTNPLPKPPRTGVYNVMSVIESSTLGRKPKSNMYGIMPNDSHRFLSHYVSHQHLAPGYQSPMTLTRPDHLDQMELLNWIPSRPGSRASIGTASTMVSSHMSELHSQSVPAPMVRTLTHPPVSSRPGYVTLPRRPRSRPLTPTPSLEPLGPRTLGDGSSFHNIASVQSPAMDRFTLLPHLINNNNNEEGIAVLDKSQEMSESEDHNISFPRSEDSPPSRPILDTIPEQD